MHPHPTAPPAARPAPLYTTITPQPSLPLRVCMCTLQRPAEPCGLGKYLWGGMTTAAICLPLLPATHI